MKHLSTENFLNIIEAGHETRNLEFKAGFVWSDPASVWIRDEVVKAVIGMTNTRDGGTIIIGVREVGGVPDLSIGMTPAQHVSFDQYDAIKGVIDSFASGVNFDLADVEYQDKTFVIINVREFELTPAICKKDGTNHVSGGYVLRKGDIYARALSGQESTIRVTDSEMKEIIDLAIDKGQRNLIRRGWRHEGGVSNNFKNQRGDF